ncbi:major facilitator superfamily domain-containing protein [Apiosordaria backusii]|uniref:Major facilitator superfamily domain-containing protein n=1 Tax=Apiosordaria backusii TaxID=314023 RepID=A0AA40K1D1_9PEZI|nr:major facilitator superfamily domain-containing protein [Apiosordaria backusii]
MSDEITRAIDKIDKLPPPIDDDEEKHELGVSFGPCTSSQHGGIRPDRRGSTLLGDVNVEIDPVIERRVRRKFDRTLVVLVFLAYMLAFLDRSNIGNAETAGMSADLGFDDEHFQWLLTIFYIPYILFEGFALMWKIMPPHIWATITVTTWGLASTLQSTAFNWQGLMVCRWFLAMAEAGFAPGVPYLLSFFYRRRELGLRCGIFLSAAPLATTFAGALAYAITTTPSPPLPPWRLLFLIEGLPTLLLAVFLYFYLPSPDTAPFLTPSEKEVAKSRLALQTSSPSQPEDRPKFGWRSISTSEILSTFESLQTLLPALMYFSCNVSFSSLPVFLPSILSSMGFSSVSAAQGLTAPPYILSFFICILSTYLADRTQQRGITIIILSLIGGAGYILLATLKETLVGARYFAVFLAAAGVFPSIANVLPWTLNNQGSDTKRGVGIAVLNMVGQCGPLLGTRLFPAGDRAGGYTKGMVVCAVFMFLNAGLAAGLRWHFVRKNRVLEEQERGQQRRVGNDGGGEKGEGGEMEGMVGFRYVL